MTKIFFRMRKTTLTIIIYALGMIFCALVLGIWDAETSIINASIALIWTTIFLIALFYAGKYDQE
jgi:succinate dehydrogenase hydrophobic anchor subunit